MWKMLKAGAATVALLIILVVVAAQVGRYRAVAPLEGIVALTGATLIDGIGSLPVEDATVLIEGGRILDVGSAGSVPIPAEARRVELRGLTLLPGLIDAHVHFGAPEVDTYEEMRRPGRWLPGHIWQKMRLEPRKRRALLENGVTSIISLGDAFSEISRLRDEVGEGGLEGPTIFAAGPINTAPGGHPAGTIFEGNRRGIEEVTRQLDDPETARAVVRTLARDGVDLIKAVHDGDGGELPRLRPEVLAALIEEAHRLDMPVAVHWGSAEELETAVRLGADRLEHSGRAPLPEETVRSVGEQGVFVVPTLTAVESVAPATLPIAMENTRRLHSAGAVIVAGTDAANPGVRLGPSMHRELKLLAEAGLPLMDVIRAATAEAARSIRRGDDLGTVERGKIADLIAVEGDPLANLSSLPEVRLVVRGGRVVHGAELLAKQLH